MNIAQLEQEKHMRKNSASIMDIEVNIVICRYNQLMYYFDIWDPNLEKTKDRGKLYFQIVLLKYTV